MGRHPDGHSSAVAQYQSAAISGEFRMNSYEWLQTILLFVVLLALVKPLGSFMAKVFAGERTFLSPLLAPCERVIYRISGVKPEEEMGWKRYAGSMLLLNLLLFVSLFIILLTQHLLCLL